MDLLSLTTGAISIINPLDVLVIQVSTGSTTADDGTPVPSYADPITRPGQVQPLTFNDLKQLEGLNIQGSLKAIYIEGHINGIVRSKNKGGDLVTDPHGNVWLVTQVLEFWPNWTKVAVTLQTDGS